MDEFDKIRSQVIDQKIIEACTALKKYTVDPLTLNEISTQESRYKKYKIDERTGAFSSDHTDKQISRITKAVLEIVDEVREQVLIKGVDQKKNKQIVNASSEMKPDPMKDRKISLYNEASEYFKYAIGQVGNDKRDAYLNCNEAMIIYKKITADFPNDPYAFLYLARVLKIMYLLNYNESRNEENLNEIITSIRSGKSLDGNRELHKSFDLIIFDINECMRKRRIRNIFYILSLVIALILGIEFLFFKRFVLDRLSIEIISTYMCMIIFLLASYYDNKVKKHITGT